MTPVTHGTAEQQLKELAAKEAAAAKERLKVRSKAAQQFGEATTRLTNAQETWELAQGEATRRKAGAVESLINSGMKAAEVGELLGIEGKELRTLRAAAPNSNPNSATGPSTSNGENPNGS
jgi:hypothetical protein